VSDDGSGPSFEKAFQAAELLFRPLHLPELFRSPTGGITVWGGLPMLK